MKKLIFSPPINKLYRHIQERLLSRIYQWKYAKQFEKVSVYVMFLGYPRSGHTLIGALLNAHPETCIAHELNALKFIQKGNTQNQLFAKIIGRNKWFNARNQMWTGYSYKVPNQWQGQFRRLKTIGDKRGGASSRRLTQHPELLDKLHQIIDKEIRIIHNQRNPFDNIATRARGGNIHRKAVDEQQLYKVIDEHFRDVATIDRILKSNKYQILTISHEDFLEDPILQLTKMCNFIGVEPYEDYLKDATSIVRKKAHKSRHNIHWPEDAKNLVMKEIAKYDFLQGYNFDN